jgi:putative membrane protein
MYYSSGMIRLLASLILHLLANAIGIAVAAILLSGFSITVSAFIFAVLIFSLVEVFVDPLLTRTAENNIPALRGGVALVTSFIGLLVTSFVSDGVNISGASTWLFAPLIIWLFALLASVVLPLFLFKKTLGIIRDK